MKKLPLFWLLSLIVFLAWCFGSKNNDTTISQPTNSWEITITSWDTVMLGWVDTWVINTGIQESIQSTKDIVWTVIPDDENIEEFLSNYLKKLWRGDHKIIKSLSKDNIISISMYKKDKWISDGEGVYFHEFVNFIIKNNIIIRSNLSSYNKPEYIECKDWQWNTASCKAIYKFDRGLVYRYTNQGILFKQFEEWSMGGCGRANLYTFTYVNLDKEPKTFYSILSQNYVATSPDWMENCKLEKEILQFFSSNNDEIRLTFSWGKKDERSLPIQAKTTEEAFYKYYKIPQPKF